MYIYIGHVIAFSFGCVCGFDSQLRASFTYFEPLLRCAHKRIVNIMKVYIKRNNIQVELIRFRKKYRLYSRLRLRGERVPEPQSMFISYSLDGNNRPFPPTFVICRNCQKLRYWVGFVGVLSDNAGERRSPSERSNPAFRVCIN